MPHTLRTCFKTKMTECACVFFDDEWDDIVKCERCFKICAPSLTVTLRSWFGIQSKDKSTLFEVTVKVPPVHKMKRYCEGIEDLPA